MPITAVLVVAAGHGQRFGDPVPKQYHRLGEKPILRYCLETFIDHQDVDLIQVVLHPDWRFAYDAATQGLDLLEPVSGGATRQASVLAGLEKLSDYNPERVLIHDAARPGITAEVIDGVLAALDNAPAALPALPVADTLKRGKQGEAIAETISREGLWRAQTPQGFHFSPLLSAHRDYAGQELTDDAAIAEKAGMPVILTKGDWRNEKITLSDDLSRAESWIATPSKQTMQWEYRTGSGFDVHKFGPGNHCWLCGIAVPHSQGLAGHSDADVGLHALTDAILGSVSDGDIGQHFPPTDERWRGASSDRFLEYAVTRLRATGGDLVNLDVTLICQKPKIGPYRDAMQSRIAEIVGLDVRRVSVKATTTEKLGFTGREEGIAAQASATIRLPWQA